MGIPFGYLSIVNSVVKRKGDETQGTERGKLKEEKQNTSTKKGVAEPLLS